MDNLKPLPLTPEDEEKTRRMKETMELRRGAFLATPALIAPDISDLQSVD